MKILSKNLLRWEFEYRIFISLGIVLVICTFSSFPPRNTESNMVAIGRLLSLDSKTSSIVGFIVSAFLMVLASVLRMWSGSILSSDRVMAFQVQDNGLRTRGPYQFVRNPIYLADLIAMVGFALSLSIIGVLLPLLFYWHYRRLVRYEETALEFRFKKDFHTFVSDVPRFFPGVTLVTHFPSLLSEFKITYDGFRYNALYAMFVLGYLVAAITGQFFYAVLIGLPGVFDWAVHHTKKGLKNHDNDSPQKEQRISARSKVFEDILYAQCWEDPQIDRKAFKIQPDDVVFSITSGGCNVLTFLLDNPKKVIALDISPYQNHLLKLKIAAFRQLPYDELLEFIGIRPSPYRLMLYSKIRIALDLESRNYWDNQENKIQDGIIHCGRFENYIRLMRAWLYRSVGKKTIEEFFETDDAAARADLFHRKWENISWWIFTKILLSRCIMTMLFDKAFFTYLDRSFSFSKHFASRTKHALTELPIKENYFLAYILLGRYYSEEYLPVYLRRENFNTIRNRLDRIAVVTDSCDHYFSKLSDGSISKFNFTNIFEWMSPETVTELLERSFHVAQNGAIMTYRNLLVFRERPESMAHRIYSRKERARSLYERDLSFMYSNYVVESIHKEIR